MGVWIKDEVEDDDYDEFSPLVMDTSKPEFAPLTMDTSRFEEKSLKEPVMPQKSLYSIKPAPSDPPLPSSDSAGSSVIPSPSAEHPSPAPSIELINDRSRLSSIANSIQSGDSMSPVLKCIDPTNQTDADQSKRDARRGSKPTEDDLSDDSEIDEDLTDIITELIRYKILPVSSEDGEKFICPICNCSLLNLHDLTVHIRSHNSQSSGSQSNTCKICGKVLSSQSSLDRHMLVHSGERPFICKVCNMSFTTNGNMHRHTRIHTKEESLNALGAKFQMRRGKSAWRQRINNFINQAQSNNPISDRMKSFSPMSQDGIPGLPNHSSHSLFSHHREHIPPMFPGMKRPAGPPDINANWALPFKRQALPGDIERREVTETSPVKYNLAETSPVKYNLTETSPVKYNLTETSPMKYNLTETSPVKYNLNETSPVKYNYQLLPDKEEEEEEVKEEDIEDQGDSQDEENDLSKSDKDTLHCPVCPKTFMCKYGLETHLETHPEYSHHCNACNLHFKTPRHLRMHRLMVHTRSDKEDDTKDVNDEASLKIGFHDLDFIDFSVSKFPLIAKHHCETNVRSPSSAYLNFSCKVCSKSFPCESSLLLHSYVHTPDKATQCPLCESDYSDLNELHTHMLKHLADKAFADIRPSLRDEKGDDDLTPDRMNKQDFLAMFLLKSTDDNHDLKAGVVPKKEPAKPVKSEKNINNEYFAKLGQTFAPGISPIAPMFSQLPMFRPGQQPSLDDFHKMLQIATNMNMLPSMGPGLLQANVAHTSPSKQQPNLPPYISIPPLIPPAHSATVNSVAKMTGEGGMADPAAIFGQFPCKYCDTMFTSYKDLKSHIRTHLGLSPYKCNLCDYSSSDKSTLIRHLRTHNGERPFQCLACEFAFTTKANCERHVRKKHQLSEKDDVEKAIGFNKYTMDNGANIDNFHSPDTVCKSCGVDFKFFRALKHHLRSHTSCRTRPYQCQKCDMGFCTKANCIRHIQKQHKDVIDNQIENNIKIIEHFPNDDTESIADSVSDDGIPLYTEDSRMTPFDSRSVSGTPQPPAAHSTPKPVGLPGRDSRHVSPNRHVSPVRHASPSNHLSPPKHVSPLPNSMTIKSEPVEKADDQPLDFSLKPSREPEIKMEVEDESQLDEGKETGNQEDAPMDLTMRKRPLITNPVAIAPKPYTAPNDFSVFKNENMFQCLYCPVGLSNATLLERHMRQQHGHLAGSENPVLSSRLAALGNMHGLGGRPVNAEALAKQQSQMMISNFQFMPNKGIYHAKPIRPRPTKTSATLQSLQEKIRQNIRRENASRSPSGADTDLSSVTKMIDATHPLNFKGFFKPDHPDDTTVTAPHLAPIAHSKPAPGMLHHPVMQIPSDYAKAIHRELDNLQKEGDVDESALSQVREMALSVKEECTTTTTTSSSTNPSNPRPILPSDSSPKDGLLKDDENSGDGEKSETGSQDKNAPAKKKRNSYADSPHKLSCPFCPRAFPWVSSLTRHLLTHTGQKPFKCPRCPVTFSTKSNRERHLIRKHGVNMLDPMSRQTMDRPYKCPLCVFSSFSTQSNLLKHYKERHNGMNLPDNVADIDKMSPAAIKAATLEMETRAAENPPQLDDSENLEMSNMDMTAEDDDDLENSVGSSEKMEDYTEMDMPDDLVIDESRDGSPVDESSTIADDEDSERNSKSDIVDNKSEEDNREKVMFSNSGLSAGDIEKIIAQQRAIIKRKAEMELKIQAEIHAQIESQKKHMEGRNDSPSPSSVEMKYEASDLLLKPFAGSAERIINPERDNYDVDKITECWKCNCIFPSRKILVRHLKEHNIDLPFKCYLCDASYDSRVECLNHQADTHRSDWSILKEKNKVGEIEAFSVHMDKVVENNCNKLDSGSILEIPGQGLDDAKMEVISADYMQRKVYCSLCPKRFWSLQDLRRHMRSHTGERPFECDICQKRFTLKHSMMRHRKKHAGAPPRSFDDDEDSLQDDVRASKSSVKPSPSGRNPPPIFPRPSHHLPSHLNTSIPSTHSTSLPLKDGMPVSSTMLFSQGLSGGTLTLGGGIGSLSSLGAPFSRGPISGNMNVNMNGKPSEENSTKPYQAPKAPTAQKGRDFESVRKEFMDCSADMLHNLLGVESSAIEKMLDSADSAAKYLGVGEGSSSTLST